jgi:uncharacterized FlaG/YvyC family protein
MASSRDDEIESPEDEALYEKLDRFSTPMRLAATSFAEQLGSLPQQSQNIQTIIEALNKVADTNIKSLDIMLNNFKKCMASLAIKNNDANIFGKEVPPEALPDLLAKYSEFIQEIATLSQIAIELGDSIED